MIADADETLRALLAEELSRVPGCLVYQRSQIDFVAPGVAEALQDSSARVNLYLHDVRENLQLRDESYRQTRSANSSDVGKRRAPVKLNLSYLITVYVGADARAEHRLLSQVLSVFLRCGAVPPNYLQGVLQNVGANGVTLSVAQPDHAPYADPPALWQALGGTLRPALGLQVTAPFDPFETRWNSVVRDARFGMVPATDQNGFTPQPNSNGAGPTGIAPVVAGIVLDGSEETPLENVSVQVLADTGALSFASTCTDARGLFALNLPPGTHTLRFVSSVYQSLEAQVVVPAQRGELSEPLVIALRPVAPEELKAQHLARMQKVWDGPSIPAAELQSTPSKAGRAAKGGSKLKSEALKAK